MNKNVRFSICLTAFIFFAGCNQSQSPEQSPAPSVPKEIQADEVIHLDTTGVGGGDGETFVIRDSSAWSTWWSAHAGSRALPAVDFNEQMVVGVLAGMRSYCYGVGIESVQSNEGKLRVVLKHHAPAKGTSCIQIMGYSADIVLVPKSDLPVEFAEDEPDVAWFRQVAHSTQFSPTAAVNYVIRDQSTWNDVWTRHTSHQQPAPLAPEITLDGLAMAVGVFSGAQPSGCWDIAVRGVYRYVDHLRVEYEEVAPAADAACPSVVNYSGDIVLLPRLELPVRFQAIPPAEPGADN